MSIEPRALTTEDEAAIVVQHGACGTTCHQYNLLAALAWERQEAEGQIRQAVSNGNEAVALTKDDLTVEYRKLQAELTHWKAIAQGTDMWKQMEHFWIVATEGRDELKHENRRLRAELADARANAKATRDWLEAKFVYADKFDTMARKSCSFCAHYITKTQGHEDGCPLAAAITAREGEK